MENLKDGKDKTGSTKICHLEINKNNGSGPRTQLMLVGDTHIGSPQTDEVLLYENINKCLEKKIYVVLMGDLWESASRHSVGAGWAEQIYSPDEQFERTLEFFQPLADAGLILGAIDGNHCSDRTYKETGYKMVKTFCRVLGIPHLGPNRYLILRVGRQSYSLYVTHGHSGAATLPGKISTLMRVVGNSSAEIVAHAHVHELLSFPFLHFDFVNEKKRFSSVPRYAILTGSYMRFGGYGRAKEYRPTRNGSPLITLWADHHEVRVTT